MLFTPITLDQLDQQFADMLPGTGWTPREVEMYRELLPNLLADVNAIGALYNKAIGIQLAANVDASTVTAARHQLADVEKETRQALVALVEKYLPQLLTAVLRQMHTVLFTVGGLAKMQAQTNSAEATA